MIIFALAVAGLLACFFSFTSGAVLMARHIWMEEANKKGFCCWKAMHTKYLKHTNDCRVWNRGRVDMSHGSSQTTITRTTVQDDIGQGEGCEGGKCQVNEK